MAQFNQNQTVQVTQDHNQFKKDTIAYVVTTNRLPDGYKVTLRDAYGIVTGVIPERLLTPYKRLKQ